MIEEQSDLPQLIRGLRVANWVERAGSSFELERRAGELGRFVKPLQQIASTEDAPGKHIAFWLLKELARRTTQLWKDKEGQVVCVDCGTPFQARAIELSEPLKYYGCSVCGESWNFFEVKSPIFCVILDNQMTTKYIQNGEIIRVNWLVGRYLFDFDWVEIIRAMDEEVERFAVKVGNDTESTRKSRYKKMPCIVSLDCHLSENTYRILRHIFGDVTLKK